MCPLVTTIVVNRHFPHLDPFLIAQPTQTYMKRLFSYPPLRRRLLITTNAAPNRSDSSLEVRHDISFVRLMPQCLIGHGSAALIMAPMGEFASSPDEGAMTTSTADMRFI